MKLTVKELCINQLMYNARDLLNVAATLDYNPKRVLIPAAVQDCICEVSSAVLKLKETVKCIEMKQSSAGH